MSRYEYDPTGTAYSDGHRNGTAAERAAIVAWLRNESAAHLRDAVFASEADKALVASCFKMVGLAADAIERGEHDGGQ